MKEIDSLKKAVSKYRKKNMKRIQTNEDYDVKRNEHIYLLCTITHKQIFHPIPSVRCGNMQLEGRSLQELKTLEFILFEI